MAAITDNELKKHVRQFLKEFKSLVDQNGLIVKDRQKNQNSLLEMGLTARQRKDIILSLSVQDYCAGPKEDIYEPGQFWVFGKHVDGEEVYIKLKISESSGEEYAVCFSFHKSEFPLSYPLT